MARKVVIDPDGTASALLAVIIASETGVVYEQQCAGILTDQRSIEGYLVPLGGARFQPDEGMSGWEDLRAAFHAGKACAYGPNLGGHSLPAERLTALRVAVGSIAYWSSANGTDKRDHLSLDDSRLGELVEAWVPVRTSDGDGILVWPNCD